MILPRRFYNRPTLDVARDLIGKVLVHESRQGIASGVIVEAEAYIGESDPACHAAPGPTKRNAPLYGPPGIAYVYLNYGIHYLVNAITEAEGWPAAVLIRALEPKDGIPLMRRRRAALRPGSGQARTAKRPAPRQGSGQAELAVDDLCRGPGNLTRALGIDLKQNLLDLTGGALRIEDQKDPKRPIVWSRRIGINVGVEQEWRVTAADSLAISGRRVSAR
jgi:DNA-3-methyladenine glycosylase